MVVFTAPVTWVPTQTETTLRYGCHDTPLGTVFIALGQASLVSVQFLDEATAPVADCLGRLRDRWPDAQIKADTHATQPFCDRLYRPPASGDVPIPVQVGGTPFQQTVWRSLVAIPYGHQVSYGALAQTLGQPQASRAVGSAVGKNPIAYFIPCHRVVRADGQLGGYRWGRDRKAALLRWETGHLDESP